jgi:hypothetical protein
LNVHSLYRSIDGENDALRENVGISVEADQCDFSMVVQRTRDELISLYSPNIELSIDINVASGLVREAQQTPELCKVRAPLVYHHQGGGRAGPIRADIAVRPPATDSDSLVQPPASANSPRQSDAPSQQAEPASRPPDPPLKPVEQPQRPLPTFRTMAWHYKGAQGLIRGPFSIDKLRRWWQDKKLPINLAISVTSDPDSFREVGTYYPKLEDAFTYNPMLFPFMGNRELDQDDQLERVFLAFDQKLAEQ